MSNEEFGPSPTAPSTLSSDAPSAAASAVPSDLVEAALRAARKRGAAVADVPMQAIAQEAGVSRSTLLRRLGGVRHALDEAVRAAGVDPGGQKPVRERAVEAGAALISSDGLAALSLERVAAAAECSVHSLYAVFGSRDGMTQAIFERYGPFVNIETILATHPGDLRSTVRRVYAHLAEVVALEPRVLPAILAEVLARPGDEATQALASHMVPRLYASIGEWLSAEVAAGRVRDLPLIALIHQMSNPLLMHLLLRPALELVPDLKLPSVEEMCEAFAEAFVHAVELPGP
ncbi:TetR/AcrR family transcriptional regulator [Streptomyces sp. NBC_00102]|uniref:TetR/AcrR family transcriptional regulator n=1 Tax=Streptomyces sp. NBC_00102 TaxID=2975652 RepID=UPI0022544EC7|nr:TetR/AcrR family transcriptional regulator [Streptomyces sp. NBC_00102]MCX5397111.1 TetR/AcrR family transcriptional regulator [Streptomyces sp. NBC_00102]